jgi:hypothetical protein
LKSALWTHILIAKDHKSTDVIATVKDNVGPTTISALQALQRKFDRPGFRVVISGLPYTTELISLSQNRQKTVTCFDDQVEMRDNTTCESQPRGYRIT